MLFELFHRWFVYHSYPIFGRGMRLNRGTGAGVFSFANGYGEANVASGFREWFVVPMSPWFWRGGCDYIGTSSSVFAFIFEPGPAGINISFRIFTIYSEIKKLSLMIALFVI